MTGLEPKTTTLRYYALSKEHIAPQEIIIASLDATEDRGRITLWSEMAKESPQRVIWLKQTNRETIDVLLGEEKNK